MDAVFYNIKSNGKFEKVNSDKKAFHYRRAIIVKDNNNKVYWKIYGSGTSDKIKKIANKIVKEMNAKNKFEYKIENATSDTIMELITKQNGIKKSKKRSKPGIRRVADKRTIPMVPKLNSKKTTGPKPKAELDDHDGPEIEEFNIAYYHEDDSDIEIPLFNITVDLLNDIKNIDTSKVSKANAKGILVKHIDNILDKIY